MKKRITDIIDWLRRMEDLAFHYYRESADWYNQPSPLLTFLIQMALDKAWRFHLMGSAKELLKGYRLQNGPLIEIDAETWQNVDLPLKKGFHRLKQEDLPKSELVESICRAEFSEWNDIFMYVLDICRGYSRTFEPIYHTLQDHGSRIESLIEDLPEELRTYQSFQHPPGMWEYRLLVIDEKGPDATLFTRLLRPFGTVIIATGKKDALEEISHRLESIVVCNLDSLEGVGTDFFEDILQTDPELVHRILVCTRNVSADLESYCDTHGLAVLQRPITVSRFQKTIQKMLEKTVASNLLTRDSHRHPCRGEPLLSGKPRRLIRDPPGHRTMKTRGTRMVPHIRMERGYNLSGPHSIIALSHSELGQSVTERPPAHQPGLSAHLPAQSFPPEKIRNYKQ